MISDTEFEKLSQMGIKMRQNIVRMMGYGRAHHFGGSLSAVEIVTALYFFKMKIDPRNPVWEERDRFIMSKGHSVPAQYAALAMLGFFDEKELLTFKHLGSILQGHPNPKTTPGVEAFTGSLGQGLSIANGMAMAARLRRQTFRIYVLMGDGELHEGQVWEAAMSTSTLHLNSVTAIIDNNQLKSQGKTCDAKDLEPLEDKWRSFGWQTVSVDGHDLRQICSALDYAEMDKDNPVVIIAHTVKGKGISFMENRFEFHNSAINQDQWELAMLESERGI